MFIYLISLLYILYYDILFLTTCKLALIFLGRVYSSKMKDAYEKDKLLEK